MSLKFRIIEKCYQNAKGKLSNGADFLLEKDGWNDYGYLVMYHLHATYNLTRKGNEYLGAIRIMKKGQQGYKQNVLETYLDCEERKMCRIYHLNDWRTAVIRG